MNWPPPKAGRIDLLVSGRTPDPFLDLFRLWGSSRLLPTQAGPNCAAVSRHSLSSIH